MTTKNAANSLDAYLLQARAGEMAPDALPEHLQDAGELAPLLAAAGQVRRLHAYRLPAARRQRAKARLRAAWLAQETAQSRAPWWRAWLTPAAGWPRVRGGVLAVLLALILLIPLTVTAIAASDPGDIAYPARIALERVPALIQSRPAPRASAELKLAERRLADLDAHLQRTGELAPTAMKALLEGDAAAVASAADLDVEAQRQIAARVADHAAELTKLAASAAGPEAQTALRTAAAQATALAAGLMNPPPGPAEPAQTQPARLTAAPTGPAPAVTDARPTTVTPAPTRSPRATAGDPTLAPTSAPGPQHTPVPGLRATVQAEMPARTPAAPATRPTTATAEPEAGSPLPGRRATALAPTAAITPTAQPTAPTPPGQTPDTPAPGRRATALAQTATPTPPPTPVQPASGATEPPGGTPAPGRRATVLAQTASPPAEPTPTETPASRGAP